jgi:hypothetical protein
LGNAPNIVAKEGNWQNPVDALYFFCYTNERRMKIMAVKIALLKSGEQLITDAMGLFSIENDQVEKLIKYQFNKPCSIVINGQFQIKEGDPDLLKKVNQLSVSLYPWPSLSKDESVEIPSDWVVTFVDPTSDLEEMYNKQVLNDDRGKGTETGDDDSVDE